MDFVWFAVGILYVFPLFSHIANISRSIVTCVSERIGDIDMGKHTHVH